MVKNILNQKELASAKSFRNTFKDTEKKLAKLKEKHDEYLQLKDFYENQIKSYEDTFLNSMKLSDVVILKDPNKFGSVNDLVANPLGIDADGKFNLDLLKYNLKNNTSLTKLPEDTETIEETTSEVTPEVQF